MRTSRSKYQHHLLHYLQFLQTNPNCTSFPLPTPFPFPLIQNPQPLTPNPHQHATIEQIMYHAAVGLIKTSVLIFYYNLPSQTRYMRLTALFVLFLNAATNIAGFFFNIFSCAPVDYWNHALTAVCVDYTLPIFVLGIANIFCDIMIW